MSLPSLLRNEWGQMTRLRQRGTQNGFSVDQSQYYYYDSQQRMCRHPKARNNGYALHL